MIKRTIQYAPGRMHQWDQGRSKLRRGLTFIELMLAIGVTAIIGAAVSSMLVAASYGTDSSRDIRASVVQHAAINSRMAASVRASRMVLAAGVDYLILWTSDTRRDGVPSLSEIRLIERNPVTQKLSSYKARFLAGLTEEQLLAADTVYALDDDFLQIVNDLKNGEYENVTFISDVWATDVRQWSLTLDQVNVQDTRLVSYRLQVQVGEVADHVIGAAALRNKKGIAGGTGDTTTSALVAGG